MDGHLDSECRGPHSIQPDPTAPSQTSAQQHFCSTQEHQRLAGVPLWIRLSIPARASPPPSPAVI